MILTNEVRSSSRDDIDREVYIVRSDSANLALITRAVERIGATPIVTARGQRVERKLRLDGG